jgi:uncharacterized protein YdgA (DUF945 family)
MSRKVKLIGAAVFLCLSAGAGALYWSGVHAQRTYEQSLSGVNSQGIFNARTASYHRGLLSSEAVTEVTFNTDSPQYQAIVRSEPDTLLKNFRLVLASDIEHLPAPSFADGGADLTITTRLDERDSKQLAWIRKAGLHDVLRLTTRVGVDGNSTVTLDVKPVTYQAPETGASLDWGGLQGKFDIGVGEQNRYIRGTMRSSGFTAHAGLEEVKMDSLHYDLDGHFDVHDFFIGSQSLVIDGLHASTPADAAGPNGAMSFGQLALQGEAHADDASLSVSSDILLTDLNAAGERIPRITLRIAADKLDMAPLAELRDLLASVNTGGGQAAPIDPALQSQIQEKLLAVLAGRPRVRITELLLETGSGTLRGNLALRLVQPPPADAVIPPLFWLSALDGEAHVTIAEPLLTLLATSSARATLVAGYEAQKQAPPPDKNLNAAAAELVRTRLSSLETLGVLLREGNEFRTDITLANSELLINGKPFQSLAPATSSN